MTTATEEVKDVTATESVPETPAPEATTETEAKVEESTGTEEKKPEQAVEEQPPKRNKVQERIDKLTAKNYRLQGELDAVRRMQPTQASQPAPQPNKPDRSQFQDDASFVEALTDWKVAVKVPELVAQQVQKNTASATETEFMAREKTYKATVTDYDDVIADAADVPISQPVAEAILSSENGPGLRYYLATHQEELSKLNGLTPTLAGIHLGRIEAKLQPETAEKKKVSQASPPISPVKISGASGRVDEAKLSDNDWFKLERKRMLAKNK
jgi:chemotaxis protein histidine kinase CheA